LFVFHSGIQSCVHLADGKAKAVARLLPDA